MNADEEDIVQVWAVRARAIPVAQLAEIVTGAVTVEHLDAYVPCKQVTNYRT